MGENDQHFKGSSLSAPGMSYSYGGKVTAKAPSGGGFGSGIYRGSNLTSNTPSMTYKYTGVAGDLSEVAEYTEVGDAEPAPEFVKLVDGSYEKGNTNLNPDDAEDSVELTVDGHYELGDTSMHYDAVTDELINKLAEEYHNSHKNIFAQVGCSILSLTEAVFEGALSLVENIVDAAVTIVENVGELYLSAVALKLDLIEAIFGENEITQAMKAEIDKAKHGMRNTLMGFVQTDYTTMAFDAIDNAMPWIQDNAFGITKRDGGFLYDAVKSTSYWTGTVVLSACTGGALNPATISAIASLGKNTQANLKGVDLSDDAAYTRAVAKAYVQAGVDYALSVAAGGSGYGAKGTFWNGGVKQMMKNRGANAFMTWAVPTGVKVAKEWAKEGVNAAFGDGFNTRNAIIGSIGVIGAEAFNELAVSKLFPKKSSSSSTTAPENPLESSDPPEAPSEAARKSFGERFKSTISSEMGGEKLERGHGWMSEGTKNAGKSGSKAGVKAVVNLVAPEPPKTNK